MFYSQNVSRRDQRLLPFTATAGSLQKKILCKGQVMAVVPNLGGQLVMARSPFHKS